MNNYEIYSLLLKCVLTLLSAVITLYVIPFLQGLSDKYKDEKFEEFLSTCVQAAEQTVKGDKKGAAKKERVTKAAKDWLKKHGTTLSDEELDDAIESMVFSLNNLMVANK